MKIGGVEITGNLAEPNEEVLVLPRRESQIIFTARAIQDMDSFEKRIPAPEPKKNYHKGKGWVPDLEDKTYVDALEKYRLLRVAYFVVESLQSMEWATVDLDVPATWVNWEKDLKSIGFTQHECNLVLGLCFQVNQLNEAKLEEARSLFVLGQEQEANVSSTQDSEPSASPSGKPAKDSE